MPVVDEFLALTEAPVERLTSKGMRRMDARAAVVSLEVDRYLPGERPPVPPAAHPMAESANGIGRAEEGCALRVILRHLVPSVRPDDVLNALRNVSDVFPAAQPLMTRLAQGTLGASGVVKP
jgi:hypothetical protein